jgi:hypothetical protein
MATRMQQRRGTASQWTTANPILNPGEIGWESDTNKFKIGDGTNHWADLDYFIDANSTVNPSFGSSITFEGATANDFETTLAVTDPTADRTITLPNVTGTVITTGNLSDITDIGVFTGSITMEGATADDYQLVLSAGDPTEDRTITFPDADGTVALIESVNTSLGGYIETSDIGAASGVAGLDSNTNLLVPGTSIIVEGTTDNNNETTLVVTDPTEDRTITFPDATGTVQLRVTDVSDTEIGYLNGVTSAIQTQMDAKAPLAGPALTGDATAVNLTISGNLTVNGTTTNLNSTNLVVEDKNVVLGDVSTPTDTTADGGGITLKGATDKTFNWVDSTDAWTSSEHINLASGKTLKYNGTDLVASQSGNSGKYLTTNGTVTSWGTVTGYSAPTLGSTSIASGATVTTIAGLTLTAPTLTGTVTASGDINLSVAGGPGSIKDEFTLILMGAI